MTDVLGVMYDFVRAFSWRSADVPKLRRDQVLRGWQNLATLPADTPEFCVISLVRSVRHGFPCNTPKVTAKCYEAQLSTVMEHVVQADFCSASPVIDADVTRLRADLLHTVCCGRAAYDFIQGQSRDLAMLYADDVQSAAFLDPDSSYSARYFFQMHITERIYTNYMPLPSFDSVTLRTGQAPPCEVPADALKNVDPFFKSY